MASGDVLHRWEASDGKPPSTLFAVLIRRNNHFFAGFDAAADWFLDFTDTFDRKYAGGGVTLVISWAAASATTGDVIWNAAFERHVASTTDLDADDIAAVQAVTSTAPATSGTLLYSTITFTNGAQMDSVAVGEHFRLRISRDANNASDTMAGNAQLAGLELRET